MIKVIAFDYGGVLGTEANAWNTTFKNVLEAGNITIEEINQIWNDHWPKLRVGKEEIDEFWSGNEKLRELYNNSITIDEEMLGFTKSLKQNYKLVILSNDTKDWMDAKIKRFSLLKTFSKVYCSGNLGVAKPDKEIFEYVLNDLQIEPDELLFIDNQKNNIEAANLLGIKTILFKNKTELISSLPH